MAATNTKTARQSTDHRPGSDRDRAPRRRGVSRLRMPNSGSLSGKRTPRWARHDLARSRPAPAAHQASVADRVMRGAERPHAHQRLALGQGIGHRVGAPDIQRLVPGQPRQDRWESAPAASCRRSLAEASFMLGLAEEEDDNLAQAQAFYTQSHALYQAVENPIGAAYTLLRAGQPGGTAWPAGGDAGCGGRRAGNDPLAVRLNRARLLSAQAS